MKTCEIDQLIFDCKQNVQKICEQNIKKSSDFVDAHPFKSCLQDFEVVYKFVLQLGLKFDFLQQDAAGKQHVHELAVRRSCTTQSRQRLVPARLVCLQLSGL